MSCHASFEQPPWQHPRPPALRHPAMPAHRDRRTETEAALNVRSFVRREHFPGQTRGVKTRAVETAAETGP